MKELFDPNGHLTDDAFGALLRDEPLDEMERLEISEHLSFCDRCVERYARPPGRLRAALSPRAGRASGLPAHPRARP